MGRASKRKKSNRRIKTYATYVVAIENWDWDFFFGVNENLKLSSDPYFDYRHLHVSGVVVLPDKYKNSAAELIFLPRKMLNEENRQDDPTPHVGTLSSERHRLMGLLSVPQDVVGDLLQMLIAKRYNWVVLNGEPMKYRKTTIRGFHFQTTFTEDDLPADL